MILRALTLAAGLSGGAVFSQFPEFSHHYVQRLGGAVDALGEVVAEFDASATALGLTRADALEQLSGTAFAERRRADMARVFARHARLEAQLETLRAAGPFMRAYHAARLDSEVVRATWADFRPAIPLTFAGLVFAGAGFLAASLLAGALLGSLRRIARRRAPA